MKAQDLFSSFQTLGSQIVQDRKAANVIQIQEKSDKPHEHIARILWLHNFLPSSKIVEAIQTLEQQSGAEQKQAAALLKEHFQYYARELKSKAYDFFHRNVTDDEAFFAKITFQNALKLDVWDKYVKTINDHSNFIDNVWLALDVMHIMNQQATEHEDMVDDADEKAILSTCWTQKSPSHELFQEAFTVVTTAMKQNIPLVRTQQQNEEVAQKIQLQEVVIWNSILKRLQQFCLDVGYVPAIEIESACYPGIHRAVIMQRADSFDISSTLSKDKETALKEFSNVQEIKAVDGKPLAQAYSNWLTRHQKHLWAKLELELEEEVHISLSHVQELRKDDLTPASKQVIQKFPNQIERLKTKQCSSREMQGQFESAILTAINETADADHIEWTNSTFKEIHAAVKNSKPGFVFGDPWREKAKEILEKRKKTLFTGNYDMIIKERLMKINSDFKTEVQPLIEKLRKKAPTELIQQTIQQVQSFMHQLRTVGAAFGFLDPTWLQSHAVCGYSIPSQWLEQAREAIMLHSFSVQSLLREENSAKRVQSSMKHVKVSDEIARECNLSLLKQLSENLEKPVKFSVLFEFAQRFHLLLLRLELPTV